MDTATADPQTDIANGKEACEFLGQSVGFENELIGQSNFPHQLSQAKARSLRSLFFPNRQVLLRRLGNPVPDRRLRAEYAVNRPPSATRNTRHYRRRGPLATPRR